jgi:hypothetical protein
MEVTREMFEYAQAIKVKGLTPLAIFLLESLKPCFGLFREGIVSCTPLLRVFVGEAGIGVLTSFQCSADIEAFIQLLEKREG